MYQVYYYDSWFESYESDCSFSSLASALSFVEKEYLSTTDSDYTAVYISWFEDGIEREIQFVLSGDVWKRVS